MSSGPCKGCCPTVFLGLPGPGAGAEAEAEATVGRGFKANIISSLLPIPNIKFTNHESLPSLHETFSMFTKAFPLYLLTDQADQIRAREYFHLSLYNRVCFDYIGHGLFSYSQLEQAPWVASSSSSFPTISLQQFDISYRSVDLYSWLQYGGEESYMESKIRKRIMAFMNISEDEYTLVFTANQSSAFKLIAESYPHYSNTKLLTVYDSENEGVQVMNKSSKKRGARILSAEFSWPNLRIQSGKLLKKIMGKKRKKTKGLFVFPLQSRVSGARYSYLWMSRAQEYGWHVLLDATALGPKDMETLGLSIFKPDFLICSFYKIFGENPSGFGCLFVKKSAASVLKDSTTVTTTIGIVSLVPSKRPLQFPEKSIVADVETQKKSKKLIRKELSLSEIEELERPNKAAQFEVTGSSSSSSSISENTKIELECKGLDHADSLGLILISGRAKYLMNWLLNALTSLQHPHSDQGPAPLVRIYGPNVMLESRAPSIAFNVFDWNGTKVDPALVQKLADRSNISLSCAFLQHIWFSDKYEEERERILETRTTATATATPENHSGISVVTASFGFLTNFEDIYRLWAFVSRFLDADFVEKERWRYVALNQKTIEI